MTVFDKALTGFRFVDILFEDTLQAIAARELGDAGRWSELISFNGLVPPYISAVRAAGVLAYGDKVLVPAPSPVISSTSDPDRVFETDIELRNGQFVISDGDFGLVSGRANLNQAIRHRLETDRGELPFHTEYGSLIRRLIGAVNGPTAALLAAQYASSALRTDPRIASIISAQSEVVGDVINVRIECQPIAGKAVQLTVVV
jgi:phage baseplate assembly protein W